MNRWENQKCRSNELAMAWRARTARDELGVRLPALQVWRPSITDTLRVEPVTAWAACGVFEWVALSYLALSSVLIVVFAKNLTHPARLLAVQGFVATVILALCWLDATTAHHAASPQTREIPRGARNDKFALAWRFCHFWRYWYPHLFFLFCFEELAYLVHLVYPGWHDAKLIAFDTWLTGVNPALWLERFAHPALNEFMQFAYFTYFVYLLVLGGVLYRRREAEAYWAVMTYSAVGYVLGYVIAMLFPVQSPWFTLAGMWHGPLEGGPFTALINFIEKCGRVRGAAFPSQHVAGAMAALWGAWRHRRWLFWLFLPFVTCMCVSTAYVRNHYMADVLGGLVTGTLGYLVGGWIMRRSFVGHRSDCSISMVPREDPQSES
jgi:membrane-associated phospholipid phosphatase